MKHALRTKITGPSGAEKLTRRLRGRRPGLNGTCAIPDAKNSKPFRYYHFRVMTRATGPSTTSPQPDHQRADARTGR